jgi:chemotaxis protein MotB
MNKGIPFIFVSSIVLCLSSCVPANKLTEEENKNKDLQAQLATAKSGGQDCQTKLAELQTKFDRDEKDVVGLRQDTNIGGISYRNLVMKYDKLNQLNEELLDKYNMLLKGNEEDTRKINGQLQMTQDDLLKKQDQLNALQIQLDREKMHLDSLSAKLKDREARVAQLENLIRQKDAAADSLRKAIAAALTGFADKGISVYTKNGKVYVSMEEKLLFPSGSTQVQPEGITALQKIAKALEANPDIGIMVEGHTDDVAMHGAGEIKDNWDLSVMRATSIVKILLSDGNIDPRRLTASGVSQYDPVDPAMTTDARKKNRRSDIILTPKLNEILKLLNNQ